MSTNAIATFGPWTGYPRLLKDLPGAVDYITTMDYTPYPGYAATISNCDAYAKIITGRGELYDRQQKLTAPTRPPFRQVPRLLTSGGLVFLGPQTKLVDGLLECRGETR
jgi:hypothetical protein